jgi:hypothetical protein
MATTLDRCCKTLGRAARAARRGRIRALGKHYDRTRDLPALVAEFADRPGHPLAQLTPEAALALRRGDCRHTRLIGRALVRRLRATLAQRTRRDVETKLDRLRIALMGEWRLYQRQRAQLQQWEAA